MLFYLQNATALLNGLSPRVFRQVHCQYFRRFLANMLVDNMKKSDDVLCDLLTCNKPKGEYHREKRGRVRKLDWVECDSCKCWCHYKCAGIESLPTGRFLCILCK